MNKAIVEKLLNGLKILKRDVEAGEALDFGICWYINGIHCSVEYTLEMRSIRNRLFTEWPKFSGVISYPVPGVQGLDPWESFSKLPRWSGEYGELRKDLLDFMISKLDYELNTSWINKKKDILINWIKGIVA